MLSQNEFFSNNNNLKVHIYTHTIQSWTSRSVRLMQSHNLVCLHSLRTHTSLGLYTFSQNSHKSRSVRPIQFIHTIMVPYLLTSYFIFFSFFSDFSYYFIPYSLIVNCRSGHLFPSLISDRKYTHILNPIKL